MADRVLIVDDYADNRELLALLLKVSGHRVVTAANGEEALTVARSYRPCLILLDLMMPVMDGEQFRAAQLQDAELRAVPVVIVSARPDAARITQKLDAAAWLRKPVEFDDLQRVMHQSWATACH